MLALRIPFLVFVAAVSAAAQQTANLHDKITDALRRMQSKNAAARDTAYDDLSTIWLESANTDGGSVGSFFAQHRDEADRVKVGFIHLLRTENLTSKRAQPGSLTESYGEYVFNLTQTVSGLHDERAIPVLVESITASGVDLVQFGDKALEPVLAQLKNPDALVRSKALETALLILRQKNDPASVDRIRSLIFSSLEDRSLVVRSAAVDSIECLEGRQQFVPALEKIAKTDPDRLPGKSLDGGNSNEYYPVRYAARRVLREMKNGDACTH